MIDKKHIIDLIRDHEPEIRALGIRTLGLFGSLVRDEPRRQSDVDLLYEFEAGQATLKNYAELQELLEALLRQKIELVPRKYLSPYIGPHILKEVEPILE